MRISMNYIIYTKRPHTRPPNRTNRANIVTCSRLQEVTQ